jgi:GGDEF domain-containing protein
MIPDKPPCPRSAWLAWLLSAKLGWYALVAIALILLALLPGLARAVPLLDLRAQQPGKLDTDLRVQMQSARVQAPNPDPMQAFDAAQVWAWPESQFTAPPGQTIIEPVRMLYGDRLVSRLALQVPASDNGLVIDLPMPRLDIAHLSYRYVNGNGNGNENVQWVHGMAGDQIPMVHWPFTNRNPAFVIPAKEGNLQIVLEIGHQGLMVSPVLLLSDPVFRTDRFTIALRTGALLGLAIVLSLVGLGAAAVFRRFSFLVVALLMMVVGFAVFTQGGVAGMYVATHTARFNDVSKFISAALYGALLPWVVATALAQRSYSQLVWRAALLWMVVGLLGMLVIVGIQSRTAQILVLPVYLILSLLWVVLMAAVSVLRRQVYAAWTLVAVLFVCVGILVPLASFWGLVDGPQSLTISSVGFFVSSLLLFYSQLLQYRQGRMVMARASASKGRDVLTGLLNRMGFEKMLSRTVKRITRDKTYAAFFYIEVSDVAGMQESYGGEGFETGMLQLAAAISSTVSVVDTVGRVAANAFAVSIVMPHNAVTANAMAQKILTRTMTIASHSVPMAQTSRIAIAWVPVFGTELHELERRALAMLHKLGPGKRIGWVGGNNAQLEAAQIPITAFSTQPRSEQSDQTQPAEMDLSHNLPSLPGIINTIERDMLGTDSERVQVKADRPMRVLGKDQRPGAVSNS